MTATAKPKQETAKQDKPESKPKQETAPEPVAKQPRFIMEPPVGCPIVWYPNGNVNETPLAARCLSAPGRGLIGVEAVSDKGIRVYRRTVPHISDPRLILHKQQDVISSPGAWDWMSEPELVPRRFRNISHQDLRIIMLYQQHRKNPSEIAELMDCGRAKVLEVLKRRDVLKAEDR